MRGVERDNANKHCSKLCISEASEDWSEWSSQIETHKSTAEIFGLSCTPRIILRNFWSGENEIFKPKRLQANDPQGQPFSALEQCRPSHNNRDQVDEPSSREFMFLSEQRRAFLRRFNTLRSSASAGTRSTLLIGIIEKTDVEDREQMSPISRTVGYGEDKTCTWVADLRTRFCFER